MEKEWNDKFTQLVNELKALETLTASGAIGREKAASKVESLIGEMTEEQLQVYMEFAREQEKTAAAEVRRLQKEMIAMEKELARRRKL